MKRMKYIFTLIGLALPLLMAACSSNENPASPQDSFDAVVQGAGSFETFSNEMDTLSVDTTVDDSDPAEPWLCKTYTVSASEAPGEFPLFDPNAEVIFPGNLLQGASLSQATPSPIPVKRGDGTIVMVIDNGADSVSRYIPEVSLSEVFNAKNQIIRDNPGILPAKFAFSVEEVHSREQFALALDVSFENLVADVDAQLSFSSDREYNRFLVKLDQSFYTIAYQLPTTSEEIFASSVTPERLAQFVYPGNPAAFISSVTYGRKFYLLIESTASTTEMEASLDASFRAGVSNTTIGGDTKYVAELENLRVKSYAYGGEQGDALSASITTNLDSLKNFLVSGADISTGLPLSYVVRSLSDPSKIVSTKLATEYDVTRCTPVGEGVENPIVWFQSGELVTSGTSSWVTTWTNYFGDAGFDAKPPTKPYGGRVIAGAFTGPNLPAVKCQPSEITSNNEGRFGFSGVDLRQTDFTIWIVARLGTQFANYPEMVLWGSGTQPRSSFNAGFRNPNQFTVTNLEDTLNIPTEKSVDQWQLFTIRFSQTDGLEVFVNGSLTPAAADPNFTGALNAFLDARVGSRNGNGVYIGEIKTYGVAVTDIVREAIDRAILVKYGL